MCGLSIREIALIAWPLFALTSVGCQTPGGGVAPSSAAPARSETASKPAERASPPIVARSACPEPVLPAERAYEAPEELPENPIPTLPRDFLTCPVDPVLQVMRGNNAPDVQQNALMSLALMIATGTARALRTTDEHPHTRHVGADIDELIQSDDDQSAVSKQRRPPYLFTLGWKF
jgi:hypothetical protein